MQKPCASNKMQCMIQLPLHFKGLPSSDVELRLGLLWGWLHFIVWVGWRVEVVKFEMSHPRCVDQLHNQKKIY